MSFCLASADFDFGSNKLILCMFGVFRISNLVWNTRLICMVVK